MKSWIGASTSGWWRVDDLIDDDESTLNVTFFNKNDAWVGVLKERVLFSKYFVL